MAIPPIQFELKSFRVTVTPTATNPLKYSCQLLFTDVAGDCEITADKVAAIVLFSRSMGSANVIAIEPSGFSSYNLPLPIISHISATPTSAELNRGKALVENIYIQAKRNNVPFGARQVYST